MCASDCRQLVLPVFMYRRKTYFDAALAEADAEAAFTSFLACLTCFSCLAVFSVAAGLVSAAGIAGVEATAEADAATTFAAGADFATLAAAAADAGLAAVEAEALAGVCANALPITTAEAMMAVISLFMIFSYSCLGLFALFLRFVVTLRKPKTPPGYFALTQKTTEQSA